MKADIIVIGTSTGGSNALQEIFAHLPEDFPIPILVVQHIGFYKSELPNVLQKSSRLHVRFAQDGEAIEPGRILIAPPNHHLLVLNKKTRLWKGAKENHARPAIDPLFRTAAREYREGAAGVVLTGDLDDGTIGLQAIKAYGGTAIVQDPTDADEPGMPSSALEYVDVDQCLPLVGIADSLLRLAHETGPPLRKIATQAIDTEFDLEEKSMLDIQDLEKLGTPSTFTCPDCSGTLWEIKNLKPLRFRCHTGHIYTVSALQEAQSHLVEDAIWSAIRALHEKELLSKRMAATAIQDGRSMIADEYQAMAEQAAQNSNLLMSLLTAESEESEHTS